MAEMDWEPPRRPSLPRLALAFVLAPLVPSFVFAVLNGFQAFSVVLFVAYACAVVLGLPAYAVLRNYIRPTALNSMVVGGLIAATPWLLLILLNENAENASVGGQATVIDKVTTWYGHLENAKAVGMIFLLGALGGLVFRLAALGVGSHAMGAEDGRGPPGSRLE
jgi:hypothetical protein